MVEQEFPEVNLIKLEKNIGIAGWNEGFKVARGEFVLVLDDDSYPEKGSIIKGIKEFSTETKIAIAAFQIWNLKLGDFENNENHFMDSPNFVGCGALIKRELFNIVGYFNEIYFIYEHEKDFSLRLYNEGYKIKHISKATIIHNSSVENRTNMRRKYFITRNYLIVLFLHFNIGKIIIRSIRMIIGRLISGVRQGGFLSISKGIISFIFLVPTLIKVRKPLDNNIQKYFRYGDFVGGFHFNNNDWYN